MNIPTKKPSDLSMLELIALVRETVYNILEEERSAPAHQEGLLALEPLSLGQWTGKPDFIKREDFYDETGH